MDAVTSRMVAAEQAAASFKARGGSELSDAQEVSRAGCIELFSAMRDALTFSYFFFVRPGSSLIDHFLLSVT